MAESPERMERPRLIDRVPAGGVADADEVLDRFLDWAAASGFELYPAQEEALLELLAGRHVVLATPTGSGKSLVAVGLHFKGLCEGRRTVYTSPTKALASEKFFDFCQLFGPENVGMLTGDASINHEAPVVCCTTEVLSNIALREGDRADLAAVVMDEFHYYGDGERGVAWQVPLIELPQCQFLLMSATLGDTTGIRRRLAERTGREVVEVASADRPVPLHFDYRETPIHETLWDLAESGRLPAYVVAFTHRESAELAQKLTSLQLTTREERARLREVLGGFRFDTPFGKTVRRVLGFGIGIHHAGLLPKYRLLVEQLAQEGLLKVICGTDTLGVGVNIPIRTVVFTGLAKYDGRRVKILSAREFHQIAGRAGRKGFDDEGFVVCQAPEHVIENRQAQRKAAAGKKRSARKQPRKGSVNWSRETFQKLIDSPPETLRSRFRITHGMIVELLQRDAERNDAGSRNFDSLRELIAHCHEDGDRRARHLADAARLVCSLYRARVIEMVRDVRGGYLWVGLNQHLQYDFSLHQSLSLFLVETLALLDPGEQDYPLDVISVVESILENPEIILRQQVNTLKGELLGRLKAEGVPYEERMDRLDEVEPPQPLRDFLLDAFESFRRAHPWVGGDAVRPKSIGREMIEGWLGFNEYVKRYNLQRAEGVLLRYLSRLDNVLEHSVPRWAWTDGLRDARRYLRAVLERTDSSLIEEWESLLDPELALASPDERHARHRRVELDALLADRPALESRIRTEVHALVAALAAGEWEEAAGLVRQEEDGAWPPERFAAAMAPFLERFGALVWNHEARLADKTTFAFKAPGRARVTQVLVDPEGENLAYLEAEVVLTRPEDLDQPLLRIRHLGW